MLIRLQQRRGTLAQWTDANTVLAAGEIAISTDDQTFKVGDGVTAWSDLPTFLNAEDIDAATLATLTASKTYTDEELLDAVTTINASIQSVVEGYQEYTNAKIADLIDSAPTTLDTLNEIAAAIQANDGNIEDIVISLGTKSDIGHTHTLEELSDVQVSTAVDQEVLYYDSSTQMWKPKPLVGIEGISVNTSTVVDGGQLSYDTESGVFTFNPAVTGVTAGSFGILEASGPFAASTGGLHIYNDGSQNLEVSLTTTISYVNLVSITADHQCASYASAKLYRVVDSVETEIFSWDLLTTKDFSWTIYDEHNLEPGTVIAYRIKGQGASATSYIGQNYDVQMWVQEVAGALGGQPTNPNFTVEVAATGTTAGGLSYADGVFTYTPVLSAAALSELTDVDLTDLSDTDVLAYDAASGTWLPGSAASSMAQLTDVHLDDALEGDTLLYAGPANGWYTTRFPTDVAPSLVSFNQIQYTTYTLQLSDKDKMIESLLDVPVTITIPPETQVAFPVGTTITIMQAGTGQVTVDIAEPAYMTLRYTPSNTTRTQFSSATLIKRDTDIWYLMGDLA